MKSKDFSKLPILLIGSGNVATHLGIALTKSGISIDTIWSRNIENASTLSKKTKSDFTDNINKIAKKNAIYIICVPDLSISEIAKKNGSNNSVLIHTSGSTNISVLENNSINSGVLYPLQTFSKTKKKLNFKKIPFLIESSNNSVNNLLLEWCNLLGVKVAIADSEQRMKLHIAAVFANNFTNHMLAISQELSEKYKIDFDLLRPLISETFEKIKSVNPKDVQTGPAIRNDEATIKKHLKSLSDNPNFTKIYSFVSESIANMYKEEK